MVKIEVTTDTPREMAEFLKEMGIDKIVGSHKCKCHHTEEPLKIPDPGPSVEAEPREIPEPQAEPEHKEEVSKINEEFDRLCKEKGLTLKPEGKNTTKKICSRCGTPFYGYLSSRLCPACKSLKVRKPTETPAVSTPAPEPVVKTPEPVQKNPSDIATPPPRIFTHCIKCNTPFKVSQTDPMCQRCRKQQDRINEQLNRDREEQKTLERERRMQEELESRTKWKVCPACGASFIPDNGNFYCNRCTERALRNKRIK